MTQIAATLWLTRRITGPLSALTLVIVAIVVDIPTANLLFSASSVCWARSRDACAACSRAARGLHPDAILIEPAGARRAILAAIRSGKTCYTALTSTIGRYRTVIDRNRHRARKSKSPSSFARASLRDTVTRTAEAVITMANNPA